MENTRGGDFVHVRLSDAGKELVSKGRLTCVDGRVVVDIEQGNVTWSERVMKAVDWELALKHIRTDEGAAIFELDEKDADSPITVTLTQPAGSTSQFKVPVLADDNDESGPSK